MGENSPFTIEKLAEAIYDMRERLIRIEERQQRAEQIETKADLALETAKRAESKTQEHDKDLTIMRDDMSRGFDGIKKTAMWAIGTLVTFTGVLIAFIMALTN